MADEQDITETDVDNMFASDGAETPEAPEPEEKPVETPAEEPVQETVETPEVAEKPPLDEDFIRHAKELGISTDGISSYEDLTAAALRRLHDTAPLVNYANQLVPHADEIRQFFDSRNAKPEPQQKPDEEWTPQKHFQEKWSGPQWEQRFTDAINNGMVVRDPDTSLWKPAPGYEVMVGSIIAPLNEAQQHTAKQWQELSRGNPYERFYEAMQEPLRRQWQKDMDERLAARQQQSSQEMEVAEFERQNADRLYRNDPVSGERVPTEEGQKLFDSIARIKNAKSNKDILSLAAEMVGLSNKAVAAPQQQPVPQAKPVSGQSESGSQQPFLESALDRSVHRASASGQSDASGEAPQVMSEIDLDNFFKNQFQKSRN